MKPAQPLLGGSERPPGLFTTLDVQAWLAGNRCYLDAMIIGCTTDSAHIACLADLLRKDARQVCFYPEENYGEDMVHGIDVQFDRSDPETAVLERLLALRLQEATLVIWVESPSAHSRFVAAEVAFCRARAIPLLRVKAPVVGDDPNGVRGLADGGLLHPGEMAGAMSLASALKRAAFLRTIGGPGDDTFARVDLGCPPEDRLEVELYERVRRYEVSVQRSPEVALAPGLYTIDPTIGTMSVDGGDPQPISPRMAGGLLCRMEFYWYRSLPRILKRVYSHRIGRRVMRFLFWRGRSWRTLRLTAGGDWV